MKYKLWFPKGGRMLDWTGDDTPRDMGSYEKVYEGVAPEAWKSASGESGTFDPVNVCEFLWKRHNIGDKGDENRPRAKEIRSMCIGDIIEFENGQYFVAGQDRFQEMTKEELPTFS